MGMWPGVGSSPVTVLGTLVLPGLEFTGVKAFFRLRPRPGLGAVGACDGTSVLVARKKFREIKILQKKKIIL